MDQDAFFIERKPHNQFLSTIVDYYFYIDVPVSSLALGEEFIIPFPRITFGYFFNHPFKATNHTLNQSVDVSMAISRISTDKISVQPLTDKVKIIGAHVKPHCLAYFTKESIRHLPWLINTADLFKDIAQQFQTSIDQCRNTDQMFNEVENVFLDNILVRDLSVITRALEQMSSQLGITDRTLRNQFYDHVGCSPKEYLRLVKMKQVAYQLKNSRDALTAVALDNNYFDQAHFNHEIKSLTGKSPKELKKEIPSFRFLQF
jgi:AraC-like DNA-binding protein